jgi:hypothetical protein
MSVTGMFMSGHATWQNHQELRLTILGYSIA